MTRNPRKKCWIIFFICLVVLLFGGSIFWFIKSETGLKPGQAVPDLGREHLPAGTKVQYNSNPPTSGPHFAEWERAGIYDQPLTDGKLVHSLEHGYIIISYNCDASPLESLLPDLLRVKVFAHNEEEATTSASGAQQPHLDLSKWKDDKTCLEFVSKLAEIAGKVGLKKLIVVPRPSLDTRIALTAWARIDKFTDFDEARIHQFVKAFRDKGPERTME